MAYKNPKDPRQKEASHKHYIKHKDEYVQRNKDNKIRISSYIREQKNKPCMDCGNLYHHYAMDFDHRDPKEKVIGLAKAARYASIELVRIEIAKCDLVCSNCHRLRTALRAGW